MDTYRQPDKVIAACDVLTYEMANFALATADPLKRYPALRPHPQGDLHVSRGVRQVLLALLQKDDGNPHRRRLQDPRLSGRGTGDITGITFLELPKGTVLCDIDNQGDVFKAKKEIGHHQCISGGIKDSQFILGTPEEMRERVKLLCESSGRGAATLINGGCNFPHDTKAENFRAMIEAVLEYGIYDQSVKPRPKPTPEAGPVTAFTYPRMVTPWEVKKAELGGVQGDEVADPQALGAAGKYGLCLAVAMDHVMREPKGGKRPWMHWRRQYAIWMKRR